MTIHPVLFYLISASSGLGVYFVGVCLGTSGRDRLMEISLAQFLFATVGAVVIASIFS